MNALMAAIVEDPLEEEEVVQVVATHGLQEQTLLLVDQVAQVVHQLLLPPANPSTTIGGFRPLILDLAAHLPVEAQHLILGAPLPLQRQRVTRPHEVLTIGARPEYQRSLGHLYQHDQE